MLAGTEVAKNINKNNANHAIVFEAIALALALEADTDLLTASVGLLGKFISVREPNIKYLGLENMVRLAEVPAVNDAIVRYIPWKVSRPISIEGLILVYSFFRVKLL